jgi:hypothetical protein
MCVYPVDVLRQPIASEAHHVDHGQARPAGEEQKRPQAVGAVFVIPPALPGMRDVAGVEQLAELVGQEVFRLRSCTWLGLMNSAGFSSIQRR